MNIVGRSTSVIACFLINVATRDIAGNLRCPGNVKCSTVVGHTAPIHTFIVADAATGHGECDGRHICQIAHATAHLSFIVADCATFHCKCPEVEHTSAQERRIVSADGATFYCECATVVHTAASGEIALFGAYVIADGATLHYERATVVHTTAFGCVGVVADGASLHREVFDVLYTTAHVVADGATLHRECAGVEHSAATLILDYAAVLKRHSAFIVDRSTGDFSHALLDGGVVLDDKCTAVFDPYH